MTAIEVIDLPAPPLGSITRPALFLDLDGTLAAIEPRPEDVKPEPWRSRLLERLLARLEGRLAVVSGRTLEEVDRILDGKVAAIAAVHGLVRRLPDGRVIRPSPPPGMETARRELKAFALDHPGLTLEEKTLSVALHYRQAPALEATVVKAAEAAAKAGGLRLQRGAMVAEVIAAGRDKGTAVREFMQEPPFAGGLPVFIGDDLTDEDGFGAAQDLGGLGVLAGPARASRARCRLGNVAAVRAWLEAGLQGAAR